MIDWKNESLENPVSIKIKDTGHGWQLFTTSMNCEGAAKQMFGFAVEMLELYDTMVPKERGEYNDEYNDEGPYYEACNEAASAAYRLWKQRIEDLSDFGAADSEPRNEGYFLLKRYASARGRHFEDNI